MKLSKEDILSLFKRLNALLAEDSVHGELYVMGGAVMCLVFDARPSTKDIDCWFKPTSVIREKAAVIAQEEQLGPDWLNDGVKGFLSDHAQFEPYLNLSHLKVLRCSAAYLLAMKCLSMRLGEEFHDEADVRYLLRYLNIGSYDKAIEEIAQYYPEDRFPQKTFYALREILGESE